MISSSLNRRATRAFHPNPDNQSSTTLSVIVPAYNAQETIAQCVESLLAQSVRADEIIVVDDASQDRTAEIACRFPVRLIRLSRNLGPGVARNVGARFSDGELLAFTDSDCVPPRDWLERLLQPLEAEGAVAVTGGYAGSVSQGFLPRLQHFMLRFRQAHLPLEIESTITSNFACRRSVFEAAGGFPVYYRRTGASRPVWGNEDEELGLLIAQNGPRVRWLSEVGVLHHFRPGLLEYLRQQRFYAQAIVVSHFRFPQMWWSRTNYNRGGGAAHVLAAGGAAAGVAGLAVALVLGADGLTVGAASAMFLVLSLFVMSMLQVPALRAMRRHGERPSFVLRAYAVLVLVDFAWLAGVCSGVLQSLGGFRGRSDQVGDAAFLIMDTGDSSDRTMLGGTRHGLH